jgi:carboxylesterase
MSRLSEWRRDLRELGEELRRQLEFARESGGLMGEGYPLPVDVPGRTPAFLCLHGFGCVPNEVELMTELGAELGLRTLAPLLPGHGTHVSDLVRTTYDDWYAASERHLLALAAAGPVIVGGQSTGALIALQLAATHPSKVHAVVALANALHLAWPFPDLALALTAWLPVQRLALPKFGGPNIRDPQARAQHLTYSAQPIGPARSLQLAGHRVERLLSAVKCPLWVGHGALDATTPVANAWRVAQQVASQDIEVHLFPNSAHILTKDADRLEVRQRVRSFLLRQAGGAR